MNLSRFLAVLLVLGAPTLASAQECPQHPTPLPPDIADTSAWCPTCAHGALETIDATLGEANALGLGVDTEVKTIMAMVRAEETGSADPDYAAITVDSGGLTYGAYQFDSNSGELHDMLARYIARGGRYASQLRPYVSSHAHARVKNSAALRSLLRQAASDPIMQQTQDDFFVDEHLKPSMEAAAKLGIRSPLGVALYVDIQTNGGIASVVKTAKRHVPKIQTSGDEQKFVQAMLDARDARYRYLGSHGYHRYLSGWLARNNDFRKALANNALGLSGRVNLPHVGESICGGNHYDARAFTLYMASLAEKRDGADEVAINP